jgi:hypothetical protein
LFLFLLLFFYIFLICISLRIIRDRCPEHSEHGRSHCASEALPLRCASSALAPPSKKSPVLRETALARSLGGSPGRLSGAIWGDLGTIFEPFSVVFVVGRAFRRKTLDPHETLAGAIESDVRASPERPKNVRKSFRERLANDCPKRTLPKIDAGPPGLTFGSLRGVLGASGGVPRRAGSVARRLRAPAGVPRERPRGAPNRPRSVRGPPERFLVDFRSISGRFSCDLGAILGRLGVDLWSLLCVRACVRSLARSFIRSFVCSFVGVTLARTRARARTSAR